MSISTNKLSFETLDLQIRVYLNGDAIHQIADDGFDVLDSCANEPCHDDDRSNFGVD
jgi:hypothetical protein